MGRGSVLRVVVVEAGILDRRCECECECACRCSPATLLRRLEGAARDDLRLLGLELPLPLPLPLPSIPIPPIPIPPVMRGAMDMRCFLVRVVDEDGLERLLDDDSMPPATDMRRLADMPPNVVRLVVTM